MSKMRCPVTECGFYIYFDPSRVTAGEAADLVAIHVQHGQHATEEDDLELALPNL